MHVIPSSRLSVGHQREGRKDNSYASGRGAGTGSSECNNRGPRELKRRNARLLKGTRFDDEFVDQIVDEVAEKTYAQLEDERGFQALYTGFVKGAVTATTRFNISVCCHCHTGPMCDGPFPVRR